MKVSELIQQLQQLNVEHQDLEVVLQKDPEGNGFFFARGVDSDAFVPTADMQYDRTDECVTLQEILSNADEPIDPNDNVSIDAEVQNAGYTNVVVLFP